jgi:hypothetical protein
MLTSLSTITGLLIFYLFAVEREGFPSDIRQLPPTPRDVLNWGG